jgi:hypothetical protein
VTAPERARLLRDQVRAIKQDLLSGAEQRERYDQRLARQEPNAVPSLPPARMPRATPAGGQPLPQAGSSPPDAGARGLMSRVAQFLRTGWTCSNCGYGALPTDKFCPKCGSKIQPGLGGRATTHSPPDMAPPSEAPAAQPAPCDTCGGRIAPGDAFCTRCGALRA